jgi:hypothetical protein
MTPHREIPPTMAIAGDDSIPSVSIDEFIAELLRGEKPIKRNLRAQRKTNLANDRKAATKKHLCR